MAVDDTVHALLQRTNPVYNYNVNQCGTVHITVSIGTALHQLEHKQDYFSLLSLPELHAAGTAGNIHSCLLQMGDGGNIEGLYQTYVDQPGACPYNATTAKGSVATYQVQKHLHLCSGLTIALAYSRFCVMLRATLSLASRSQPSPAGLLQL